MRSAIHSETQTFSPSSFGRLAALWLALAVATMCPSASSAAGVRDIRPASGGGPVAADDTRDDLSPSERGAIENRARQNVARFRAQGTMAATEAGAPVSFTVWPVAAAPGVTDAGIDSIVNFVDHNEQHPGQVQDFACGERTYDGSGYDRAGTDIGLWPFPWTKMNKNEARVVAAAPGIIVYKQDGNPDRSCDIATSTPWNAILVQHRDGTTAWYGHLKSGSLTPKGEGASVRAGEFLGVVGSSGASSGPHLHFEVHAADGSIVDPFIGACNTRASARWREHMPYEAPRINSIATHSAPPVMASCPSTHEVKNFKNRFAPGERIVYAVYLRDQPAGQPIDVDIVAPNGVVADRWQQPGLEGSCAASYWYWDAKVPADALAGTWTMRVKFAGKVQERTFVVRRPTNAG
jgi:hypothetical protein